MSEKMREEFKAYERATQPEGFTSVEEISFCKGWNAAIQHLLQEAERLPRYATYCGYEEHPDGDRLDRDDVLNLLEGDGE